MRTIRTAMAVMGLAGAGALGTACGDDDGGAADTTVAGGQSADATTITISGLAFPESTTVAAGSTFTITNEDSEEHSFTADDGSSFDTDIEADESADVTAPSTPGTYTFHCKYHSSMKATLVVE